MAGIGFFPQHVGAVTIEEGSITNATLATDALDANALADSAIDEIQEAITLEIRMKRSTQSGSLLMDGTEQQIYELDAAETVQFFGECLVIMPASAGGTITVRVYKDLDNTGYVQLYGNQYDISSGIRYLLGGNAANAASGDSELHLTCRGMVQNVYYKIKVTLEQDTVGAGYVTPKFEIYDTLG